jgi:hypothetical protein
MLVAGCRRLLSRLAMNTGRAGYERFAGLGIGSLGVIPWEGVLYRVRF